MQESNEGKTNNRPDEPSETDVTSDDTLADLEENEEGIESGSSAPDPGPSPDGAVDNSEKKNDAGPM